MTSVPQYPPPAAEPGAVSRLLAGILGVFAAALVVAGTFLPAATTQVTVEGRLESAFSITSWTRLVDVAPAAEQELFAISHVARYGIPLSVTAAVLLAGAVLAFTRARAAARITLIAGGAGVVAAVWTMSMDVSASLSYEQRTSAVVAHYTTGTGFWLLLGGGVVAALVLALAAFGGARWPREQVFAYAAPGYAPPGYASPPQPSAEPPEQGFVAPEPEAPEDRDAPAGPTPPFPPQDVQPAPGVEPPDRHRDDAEM
ncbi:hypothetical protein [Amycolatopsis sp. FDAARGOS 1241]|uniref:hypothetical protein n=1 Tax=Amycolatopsis sp. FDAARGOS 1241 TaxID=2778070 RepID=UPI00195051E2|nr:hypothetical protein [Amycolatopsis sp. FDAARGOS 1241]QRP44028.1 hypothetical protein I6J71_32635 [Amycolatopsis sp. FDAARGOS 1241]